MTPRHRTTRACLAAATLLLAACMPRPGIDLSTPDEQPQASQEDPCQRNFYIAYEYYRENLLDEAIAKFEEAIECNPKDTESMALLGQIFREKEDYADAEKYLQQAVALAPDSVSYREDLGWVLIARGQYDEGIAQYGEVIRLRPDNTSAWVNQAFAYERKGRILRERAEAMMEDVPQEALEAEEGAIAAYMKVNELDPSNVGVLLSVGALHLARKEYEKALPIYERYNKSDPNNPEVLRTLAELYYETQRYEQAGKMYTVLVQGDPARGLTGDKSDPEKWYRLAYSFDKAQQALKDGVEGAGAAADSVRALRSDYRSRSAEAYAQLLELDPTRLPIYWRLGEMYIDMGRLDSAISIVDRGLKRNPPRADDKANAYTIWGKVLEKKGQYRDAIDKFELVLDLQNVSGQWLTYAEEEIDRQKQLIKRAAAIQKKKEYDERMGGGESGG